MSLSILTPAQAPHRQPLPPISGGPLLMLVLIGLGVFAASAFLALRMTTGTLRQIDYMIIGTGSAILALVAIFIGIRVNRRKLFVSQETDERSEQE